VSRERKSETTVMPVRSASTAGEPIWSVCAPAPAQAARVAHGLAVAADRIHVGGIHPGLGEQFEHGGGVAFAECGIQRHQSLQRQCFGRRDVENLAAQRVLEGLSR
jgi:hypothetical protein